MIVVSLLFFFFFQAEDGIRDVAVTGVQTCALPISDGLRASLRLLGHGPHIRMVVRCSAPVQAKQSRHEARPGHDGTVSAAGRRMARKTSTETEAIAAISA